ncbi:MAG: sarcosine oxidase subunit gamma [Pelagimonas sp.]|uniref:sarcosine oxidase subunit gamma n=1 Tax=Pelagimonas sp. TaxID=2073170 RepID=UPI003D6C41E6
MSLLAPFPKQLDQLNEAMERDLGFGFPKPGEMQCAGDIRCQWFGHNQAMLTGDHAQKDWQTMGLVTDQSDAWVVLLVQGLLVQEVLARLFPIDLATDQFPVGHTARSQCGHLNVCVSRTADCSFEIMAFRSMAQSLKHELTTAATLVAARARLA